MHIDWFTLVAQIINFLILMGLLQHFLFKPVLKHMDEREQRIENQLQDARKKRQTAEQEAEAYRQQQQDLNNQKDQLLAQSKREVETQKKEMMEQARKEVNEVQAQWKTSIRDEQDQFIQKLIDTMGHQVFEICNHLMANLASDDLDRQMLAQFLKQYQQQPQNQRAAFESIMRQQSQVLVESHSKIPDDIRSKLEQSLLQGIKARYQVNEDLIGGLVIHAGARKLSWTIRNYLEGAQETFKQLLNPEPTETQPDAQGTQPASEATKTPPIPSAKREPEIPQPQPTQMKRRELHTPPELPPEESPPQAIPSRGRPAAERSQPEPVVAQGAKAEGVSPR